MSNITIVLDGVTLPTPNVPFKELNGENATDVRTLDGTLYTDWINRLRSWELTWLSLSATEYDAIKQIYDNQFTNNAYPLLEIDFYGISVLAKVGVNEKDIRWDGDCVHGFSITLTEQWAIS